MMVVEIVADVVFALVKLHWIGRDSRWNEMKKRVA